MVEEYKSDGQTSERGTHEPGGLADQVDIYRILKREGIISKPNPLDEKPLPPDQELRLQQELSCVLIKEFEDCYKK